MSWERRDADETPRMEQRELRDDRGRRWVGSVRSGSREGGEQHAEVVFVCEDQPSELKLVGRLDVPAADADDAWSGMGEEEMMGVFRDAEPL